MSNATALFPPCCCECLAAEYELVDPRTSAPLPKGAEGVAVIPLCPTCRAERVALGNRQSSWQVPGILGTLLSIVALVASQGRVPVEVSYALLAALGGFVVLWVVGTVRAARLDGTRPNACRVGPGGTFRFGNVEYQRRYDENVGRLIRFDCPHCGSGLGFDRRSAGTSAPCPACKKPLTVPAVGVHDDV